MRGASPQLGIPFSYNVRNLSSFTIRLWASIAFCSMLTFSEDEAPTFVRAAPKLAPYKPCML